MKAYKDSKGNTHFLMQGEPKADWVEFTPDPNPPLPQFFEPPYNIKRMQNYARIEDQLDMLWHELNANGTISTTGEWFNSIKNIKEKFPKP